jgi:hypothetical protein
VPLRRGIPKSEPFLLQKRPSCIFQSMTPRLGKIQAGQGSDGANYASVSMDRAHWKPRYKGAGKFGTGKRPQMILPGGNTPGPGAHDGTGTLRWPPPYAVKSKMQLGGFKADLPARTNQR